jgi:tetratricopeptide (TPR) repeat protein
MLARILDMLGFRKEEGVEKYLERFGKLSPAERKSVIEAYVHEDVADSPSERCSQAALKFWRSGKREEALAQYMQAVSLAPNDSVIALNRAHLHLELGNLSEAVKDFERARQGVPRLPEQVFSIQAMLANMSPEAVQLFIQKRRDQRREN